MNEYVHIIVSGSAVATALFGWLESRYRMSNQNAKIEDRLLNQSEKLKAEVKADATLAAALIVADALVAAAKVKASASVLEAAKGEPNV